jgi:predicted GNAT superfamily acetyltransferase
MAGDASAWDLVRRAADRAGVSVSPLDDLAAADRVRHVISAVWGEQVLPRELLKAFQHAGCVLYGAEADGELVGFVLGFAGLADGLHVHSHMLASVPGRQDRGVGFALKLAQRAHCLDLGIDEVRWTFDPLVARNARFNLVKLGAEAFRFLPDFYGEMTDRLNQGDRSDRFEVRWQLSSDRVDRALRGDAVAPPFGHAALVSSGDPAAPEPEASPVEPGPGATVAVPPDLHVIKEQRPELARRWRNAAAEAFQRCFDRGLVATWFDPGSGYVFELGEPPP